MTPSEFRNFIWNFYKKNKRDFPWRNTTNSYHILVSEVMLQQTQTSRVIEKYNEFIKVFPDIQSLAVASQSDVLKLWHGLGYNRRALYLKRTAEIITKESNGKLPDTIEQLVTLPGIGKNTAGAFIAFARNKPVIFIETNIRRVFIHKFFKDAEWVSDKEILALVEKTLPQKDIRNWYYALMDYGVYLSKNLTNPNRKSMHYKQQSQFEGSIRQTRGVILKALLEGPMDKKILLNAISSIHFEKAIEQLINEGFVQLTKNTYAIKS